MLYVRTKPEVQSDISEGVGTRKKRMARPSSAAAGGETYIPIPDEDEDQLQRRAGAVAKLEKRLNLLELPATAIAG